MYQQKESSSTNAPLLTQKKWSKVPKEIEQHRKAIGGTMADYGILEGTKAQVGVILDVSGSMTGLYNSGKVQTLLNKALGMAACLDDNGNIEIFPFGSTCASDPVVATFENFKSVIQNDILSKGYQGGTNYAEAVKAVRNHYFKDGKTTTQDAVYILFITDGQPNDPAAMKVQFREASHLPIFFKIITLTDKPTEFPDLKAIDEATDHFIDNCDHKNLTNPDKLSPKQMLDEFPQYLNEAYQKGMITVKPHLHEAIVNKPRENDDDSVDEEVANNKIDQAQDAGSKKSRGGCCTML